MKAQVDGAGDTDTSAALFEALGRAKAASELDDAAAAAFKPRFPGNRVMEENGLAAKHEGVRTLLIRRHHARR